MKIVQKGNRQLKIPDEQLSSYLGKGYALVDEKTGKLIQKESKEAVLRRENAALKAENKSLREQLEAMNPQKLQ